MRAVGTCPEFLSLRLLFEVDYKIITKGVIVAGAKDLRRWIVNPNFLAETGLTNRFALNNPYIYLAIGPYGLPGISTESSEFVQAAKQKIPKLKPTPKLTLVTLFRIRK